MPPGGKGRRPRCGTGCCRGAKRCHGKERRKNSKPAKACAKNSPEEENSHYITRRGGECGESETLFQGDAADAARVQLIVRVSLRSLLMQRWSSILPNPRSPVTRSEERRVGKERSTRME